MHGEFGARIKMKFLAKLVFVIISLVCVFTNAATQTPYIFVLGIAQDAGFPQAGCFTPLCMSAWENTDKKIGATSIAVIDNQNYKKYIFEASPNLPNQLFLLEQEAPQSDLDAVFITHAHIGHYTGLMYFGREAIGANNIPVYVMPKMEEYLRSNGPWSQLVNLGNIVLRPLHDKTVVALKDIEVTPFLVPHRDEYSETVGFLIKGPNKEALFIPDINKWSQWDEDIAGQVKGSDYAFLDATFFNDTELPGRDMSKIPHPFVIETMEALAKLSEKHRQKVWFIHMNHTNPLLDEKSAESKYVRAQGFNIARQGLRFSL